MAVRTLVSAVAILFLTAVMLALVKLVVTLLSSLQ